MSKEKYKVYGIVIIMGILICMAIAIGFRPVPKIEKFKAYNKTNDLKICSKVWIKEYFKEHQKLFLGVNKKIKNYKIKKVEILDQNKKVVRIDFEFTPYLSSSNYFVTKEYGIKEDNKISSQWVLFLDIKKNNNNYEIKVKQKMRPAAYDAMIYQESGKKEEDQENAKIKTTFLENDYKIENNNIYVTYDQGNTWTLVDNKGIDFTNNRNYLDTKYYQVDKESTLFANHNDAIFSIDQGKTFKKLNISANANIEYIHFINSSTGFIVNALDASLGGKIYPEILKTTDQGQTFQSLTTNIESLHTSSEYNFINENLGFITDYFNGKENGILYITNDYQNFRQVEVPSITITDSNLSFNEIYDTPLVPTLNSDGSIDLIITQGSDGDYKNNNVLYYKSYDNGTSFEFVKEGILEEEG